MDYHQYADMNQKIRSNKVNKNRQERMKIKELVRMMQLANGFEDKIKDIIEVRNKK